MGEEPAVKLLPAENMVLTMARSRLQRGLDVEPNTAAFLVCILDRLLGLEPSDV